MTAIAVNTDSRNGRKRAWTQPRFQYRSITEKPGMMNASQGQVSHSKPPPPVTAGTPARERCHYAMRSCPVEVGG